LKPFIKKWLDPRLAQPVGLRIDRFEGWQEFFKKAPRKAQKYFEAKDAQEIVGVIGLLDLYGPTSYPTHLGTARERYEWGVEEMERRVGHRRKFRMFFAVHEVEAWILSQPDILPIQISNPDKNRMTHPENINFDEPPSYLLDHLFTKNHKKHYKKTTHSVQLLGKLDPEVAYDKCPYLKEMLDEMLRMARANGL